MNHSALPPTPVSPAPSIALTIVLDVVAVLACGIPFVPPLRVVPLTRGSLFVLARVISRRPCWTRWRVFSVALALAGFALDLAFGHHHLIDWLEGH